jgi:fumarate hydratase subunit alpha
MRDINVSEITKAIRKLCIDANYYLSDDIRNKLKEAYDNETFDIAKDVLSKLIINADIAKNENVPMCQDTGVTCVFIEIGQEVHITGGSLEDAINQGVREGYEDGYLRKSVVIDPLNRVNTKDNTPAMITYDIVPGEGLKIKVSPKGFGSENMSKIKMLKPSDGVEGVKEFILQVVKEAGPNPCPPIIVGVGIGGTFDKAALIAKKSLLRSVDERNSNPYYAELEMELLDKINKLGIGPQGFGGKTTALSVNIEYFPTHIAGLPVAVNISCHATRHTEVEL